MKNIFLKTIFTTFVGVILSACATGGGGSEKNDNTSTIKPITQPEIVIDSEKFNKNIAVLNKSKQFQRLKAAANDERGLQNIVALRMMMVSGNSQKNFIVDDKIKNNQVSIVGHTVYNKDGTNDWILDSAGNVFKSDKLDGNSNATLWLFISNLDPSNTANSTMGLAFNSPLQFFVAEEEAKKFNYTTFSSALKKSMNSNARMVVYDFDDSIKLGISTTTANDNTANPTISFSHASILGTNLSTYLLLNKNNVFIAPSGSVAGGGSYGYNESYVTGAMVQYSQVKAEQNNIALSVAVHGSKGSETPWKNSVLPGTLKDYAFAVSFAENFGTGTTGNDGTSPVIVKTEANSRIANIMLASSIHTLGSFVGDNTKAISLLKTNFTHKKYGTEATFSNKFENGKLYIMSRDEAKANIAQDAKLKAKILDYYTKEASQNGDKIDGQAFNNKDDTKKWDIIMASTTLCPLTLSTFITNSDVILTDEASGEIIFMNGERGKIEKITQNGTTYYKLNGKIIASNVFGNGIVDFTGLNGTNIAGTNYSVFNSKIESSSVFGNAFKSAEISRFLSEVKVDLSSIYEGEGQDVNFSLNANVNYASNVKDLSGMAIENFRKNKVSHNAGFNLGTTNFGFTAVQNYSSFSNMKNHEVSGIITQKADFIDFKAMLEGKNENSEIQNINFFMPLGKNLNAGFLSNGTTVDVLKVGSSASFAKNFGFSYGYKSFTDVFDGGKNIKAGSFGFNSKNLGFNSIFAVNDDAKNNNASSLGMLETSIKNEASKLVVSLGVLSEEGKLLGSSFTGGFGIKNQTTTFVEVSAEHKFNNGFFVNSGLNYGASSVNTGGSLVKEISGLTSSSFNAGFGYNSEFGKLAFNYYTGLAVRSGEILLFNGLSEGRFGLKTDAVEQNFELSFAKVENANSNLKFAFIHVKNPLNVSGESQNIVAIKASKKFK